MVIMHMDMGYGLLIWEMTVVWIRSSPISIWDILSLFLKALPAAERARGAEAGSAVDGRGEPA
jgi:hypothetical protein